MWYLDRTLPLSVLIGIPIVALCYLVVNFSFFAILSYEQILRADTVALVSTFVDTWPAHITSLSLLPVPSSKILVLWGGHTGQVWTVLYPSLCGNLYLWLPHWQSLHWLQDHL